MNVTLELNVEGRRRFLAALEGMRKINPTLSAERLVFAIFLYGLDKVELELAVANLPRNSQGRIVTPS